ncbi:MAG: hypothetical protein JXB35_00490 [Anaerolineae bacterium]|nr:hypothetical protein [Anaerolineae bacterium]
MKFLLNWLRRWGNLVLGLLLLVLVLTGEAPNTTDTKLRLRILSTGQRFDFFSWELQALARKAAYGLLAPQRFMEDPEQSRLVLDYLDQVAAASALSNDIEKVYVDPDIQDPDLAMRAQQRELAERRAALNQQAPVAEAILEQQVSVVLNAGGFGPFEQILPPVSGAFTPLPYLLIVSPRERIESLFQAELVAGLTTSERQTLEEIIMTAEETLSAYVTGIGGLSAYPAMLLESSSIDWVTDVIAHEWTHHYLMQAPLGWNYGESAETRTINETTASLVGNWAGQEVVRRFYAPLLDRPKTLPDPLTREQSGGEPLPPAFDFRAEMHETRINVDQMLADGQTEEAEAYMEARRRYFVEQGYNLRRLNQAYFAFHGAYASAPGASGADPIGPVVRRIWAISETPRTFVQNISRALTLADVERLAHTMP